MRSAPRRHGQPGPGCNVGVSGHDDYKGQVFKNLHNVHKGDEVIVDTEKGRCVYVITGLRLGEGRGRFRRSKAGKRRRINPTPDQTLDDDHCWPYGIDDHRFMAIAQALPVQPERIQRLLHQVTGHRRRLSSCLLGSASSSSLSVIIAGSIARWPCFSLLVTFRLPPFGV